MQNRPHRMDDRRRGASWILHVKAALGLPNTAPHTLNLVPCMQKMQQKQKGQKVIVHTSEKSLTSLVLRVNK